MADDKTKTGGPDRERVAAGQPYEVSYFAGKHGISAEQARQIIERCGPDRERADQEAAKLLE